MRKIFITVTALFFFLITGAQTRTLYVVFNVSRNTENSIEHGALKNYNAQFYRYQPHSFYIAQAGLYRIFSYANQTDQPDDPVIIQPTSFLETVEYLDWNSEVMNYSMEEFYTFLNGLSAYDKVYFIDRSEIKDGKMKMYPVKELKSRF